MTIDDVISELQVILGRLKPVLDDQGKRSLESSIARMVLQAKSSKGGRRHRDRFPWDLTIPPASPISFRDTTKGEGVKHRVHVDISCHLTRHESGDPKAKHNICVRVWSREEAVWYRPLLDAESLGEKIRNGSKRRVMMRFHFDFADVEQGGPRFHLQIGGKQNSEEEACWHLETLNIPRFPHHPVNLLMVCEFVGRTFYPVEFAAIRDDAIWKGALGVAQSSYLVPFFLKSSIFQGLTRAMIRSDESYLATVWNT